MSFASNAMHTTTMTIDVLTSREDLEQYDAWIQSLPDANLWQSLQRKKYLEVRGKDVRIYAKKDDEHIRASALVMIDKTKNNFSTWDIPRGPLGDDCTDLLKKIINDAKQEKCIALFLHGDQKNIPSQKSPRHIHCEATRIIDLTKTEDEILKQMKPKGRYNIKVANKHDIIVKESHDIDAFYELVTETGSRDGFTHLPKKHYQLFLDYIPGSFLLLAYDKETKPIAGVLSVIWKKNGIYYYGASNHAERAKMAPYLLQWESIIRCKALGCTSYDLLGIAPEGAGPSHPWTGITSFKEKFGGEILNYPAEQMIILKPVVYWLLQMKRKIIR